MLDKLIAFFDIFLCVAMVLGIINVLILTLMVADPDFAEGVYSVLSYIFG